MNQPTTTRATTQNVQDQIDGLRQRASELHRTADQSTSIRYGQRGAEFDRVARAADSARLDSETARQQAENLREEARNRIQLADEAAERQTAPGAETREMRQAVANQRALAQAAEERADQLDKAADESWARYNQLHEQARDLEQATGDESVANHLHGAAGKMEAAADQLDEKVRLLVNADDIDRQAAEYEAQGDTLNAELFRGEAAAVRARADVIQPEIPEVDQRILDAAGRAWAPEGEPTGVGEQQPQQPTPAGGPSGPMQPQDPYATADADGDGLSDEFERQLGTNVNDADTDRDGWSDGLETAVGVHNPRVKEAVDLDPQEAADKDQAMREWEAEQGVEHNADTDGDGVADWVEALGGYTKDANLTADDIKHNLSGVDDFVESAKQQIGKPYRFGAEVDPADTDGGQAFDSSELVEWAAKQAGVRDMPDGSWKQYQHLEQQGGATTVQEALNTKGALVFGFSSDPTDSSAIPDRRYVAISMGDGQNVLDVSELGAVRVMPAGDLYNYAAKIPALHTPQGDLDGDGWSDQEEMQYGGDPSRSVTWSQETGAIEVEGQAPADPNAPTTDPNAPAQDPNAPANQPGTNVPNGTVTPPAGVTDPLMPTVPPVPAQDPNAPATTDPNAPASGSDGDPLGTDRYPSDDPTGDAYADESYTDESYSDTGGTGATTAAYSPDGGEAYGGDTGNGSYDPAAGGTGATTGSAGTASSSYGDSSYGDSSYGDSGSADAVDDSYSDASTYE